MFDSKKNLYSLFNKKFLFKSKYFFWANAFLGCSIATK